LPERLLNGRRQDALSFGGCVYEGLSPASCRMAPKICLQAPNQE